MSLGSQDSFTADELALIPKPDAEEAQQTTGQEGAPPAPAPAPASEPPAPAPAPTEPSPTPAPAATAAPAAPAPASEPQGDVRAALRAARRGEHRAREEAERLRRENEELLARVAKTPDPNELTDEEIAQLEQDAPVMGKAARLMRDAKVAMAAAAPAPTPQQQEFVPPQFNPDVQDAIDQVPDLLTWQYAQDKQALFQAAIQQDNYLRTLPAWANKPMAERFAEVVKRVKADAGAPSPDPTPRTDPAAVIAAAPRTSPSTLSDIAGGGGAPQTQASNLERYAKMTEDQIIADLARG